MILEDSNMDAVHFAEQCSISRYDDYSDGTSSYNGFKKHNVLSFVTKLCFKVKRVKISLMYVSRS